MIIREKQHNKKGSNIILEASTVAHDGVPLLLKSLQGAFVHHARLGSRRGHSWAGWAALGTARAGHLLHFIWPTGEVWAWGPRTIDRRLATGGELLVQRQDEWPWLVSYFLVFNCQLVSMFRLVL